jgi:hypothetical protein
VYKPCSSSLCDFFQPPVTSSLLRPNILLSILFSNTLNLCSSFNVIDQVSHPYCFITSFISVGLLVLDLISSAEWLKMSEWTIWLWGE